MTNTKILDGNSQKFELFEEFFQTMLKMQPEMTKVMKTYHFHSHLRKNALQNFRNIIVSNKRTLGDVLSISVRRQTQSTAKRKWNKFTFDPNTNSFSDFLEELNEFAKRAFAPLAQQMIDCSLYAKLLPHLKRSINLAHSENGINEQLVSHLEKELELSGLEIDGQVPIPTVTTKNNDNKQRNPNHKTPENNKYFADLAKREDMSLKKVGNAFVKSRNGRVKNKLPTNQKQKHTHLVPTDKELINHRKCSGAAQTRLTDLPDAKLKTLITQQTTVINQERQHKMPRHPFSRIL